MGYYDLVKFFQDHLTIFNITTEVDCESLFSQAGHAAHPSRNRTVAETFERLVIAKHRLSRIYCCPEKVKFEFLDRWKRKAWSDKEDRDDIAFWEQQKKEYLQLNPTHHQMIAEFEAEVDTAEDVYMEDVV